MFILETNKAGILSFLDEAKLPDELAQKSWRLSQECLKLKHNTAHLLTGAHRGWTRFHSADHSGISNSSTAAVKAATSASPASDICRKVKEGRETAGRARRGS